MPTLTIHLTEELDAFVRAEVENGRFETPGEVISAGLRTLEREERDDDAKLAALRQAIDDGIASGVAEGDVFARVRERAGLPPRTSH